MKLRRYIVLFVTLFSFVLSASAEKYRVNVDNTLNVREMPNSSAKVIGKLNRGDIVECLPIDGNIDWMSVTFSNGIGYVNASYLVKYKEEVILSELSSKDKLFNLIFGAERNGNKNMAYWILFEVLLMWIICKFVRKISSDTFASEGYSSFGLRITCVMLLLLTSGTIFYYIRDMGVNALWFMQPSVINSWWYAIVNFVIFLYVFINLFVFFLKTMDDLSFFFRGHVNVIVGLFGWGIGILALITGELINADWLQYILWFELLVQGIQLILIAINLWNGGGLLGVFVTCLVYLISSVTLVMLTIPLLVVAFAIIAVVIVLCIITKNDSTSQIDTYNWKEWRGTIYQAGEEYNIDDYAGNTHRISSEHGGYYYTTDGQIWNKDGVRNS